MYRARATIRWYLEGHMMYPSYVAKPPGLESVNNIVEIAPPSLELGLCLVCPRWCSLVEKYF